MEQKWFIHNPLITDSVFSLNKNHPLLSFQGYSLEWVF